MKKVWMALYSATATMGIFFLLLIIYFTTSRPDTLTWWEHLMTIGVAWWLTSCIERMVYNGK